jgi:hypothetical protein
MICLMHEGTPYGHLKVNQKVIHAPNLARIVGATLPEVEGWLQELEAAGVCSRDGEGCYLSRRMIRDEALRQVRAESGKKGGNPALKKRQEPSDKVDICLTGEVNQNPTPAFALASSSASALEDQKPCAANAPPAAKRASRLPDDWTLPPDWLADAEQIGLPSGSIPTEAAKFRDYWIAKSGKDATKADWRATWRNWCRTAVERTHRPTGKPSKHDLSRMNYTEGVSKDGSF